MLIESMVLSLILGKIRGGKLSRLSKIKFNKSWLFVIALLLQLSIMISEFVENSMLLKYGEELYILSYFMLIVGILFNLKYKSLIFILVGAILNLSVFIYNNGQIPVSIDGLKLAGLEEEAKLVAEGNLTFYVPLTESAKFNILADIITMPKPYPYPRILSIGDIFITLALFLFIQVVMLDETLDRSINMVRFRYGR